jgi:2-oxoglutarate ferredoxin oxidoreductase subunit alpha
VVKSFYLKEGELEKFNLHLQNKYARIYAREQRYEGLFLDDATVAIVAYGVMARIAKGLVKSWQEKGEKIGLVRPITLWPFPDKIFKQLIKANRRIKFLTVEMSYGQMFEDVKLAVEGKCPVEFLGRSGGGIPTEKEIEKKLGSLLHG